MGERMAEAVASADQATTTNLRDATAAAADAVGQGASKLVDGVVGAASAAGGAAKSAMEVGASMLCGCWHARGAYAMLLLIRILFMHEQHATSSHGVRCMEG